MSQISRILAKFDLLAHHANERFRTHKRTILLTYTALFLIFSGCFAGLRLLWFDEFLTLYVIRFHSLAALWNNLKTGVELNPPLFHLLTRASYELFGRNAVALRVPAMVGFWTASVCVFIFVRRRTNPVFAALATLFLLSSTACMYAYEGRPYGIVLGCCGIALVAWQAVGDDQHRRLALFALGASLAIAVSCHYYAGLLLFPLMTGELVKTIACRRIDTTLWLVMIAGVSPLALFVPLIRAGLRVHDNEHVWNKPQLPFMWESYYALLGYACVPLALILLWAAARKFRETRTAQQDCLPYHEVVAVAALVLLPLVGFAVACNVTNMITERYVLPSIAGCGVAFAFACWKAASGRSGVALICGALLVLGFVAVQGSEMHEIVAARSRYSNPEMDAILRSRNIPIVLKPLQSLPFQYYSAPEFRSRLLCVLDFDKMYQFQQDDSVERLLIVGQGTLPIRLESFNTFRQHTREFFIFGGPVDWVEQTVASDGGSVKIAYWKDKRSLLILAGDKQAAREDAMLQASVRRSTRSQ